jgi:hypothetical protein
MPSLFFSYSHADEAARDELEKHFAPLKHEGLIEAWHDRRILVGEPLDDTISERLNTADIVLALISSDFIDSRYCYGIEMKRAFERQEANECDLVAVILRPCDWQSTPLRNLLAAPKDGRAISKWPDRDEAYLDVTMSLRRLLGNRTSPQRKKVPTNTISLVSAGASRNTQLRSSNLRLRKEFNDHDRDKFITETFEFIANYFEGSANELKLRNLGVECYVRRIDANRFTTTAYRNGKSVSACTVFLGSDFSRSKSIGYSNSDSGATNTWNARLSIENDDQTMFFVASFSSQGTSKMSAEGVAEHLWSMFIEPLQRL